MAEKSFAKQRGAPLIARILDTALGEIARVGPYDLSIDEVAKRAQVNKTTIYRRWQTPAALAIAAFAHGSTGASMPDTGTLRQDLIDSLHIMREVCRTPAMLSMVRMQFSGDYSGELGQMVKALIENESCDTLVIFERAVTRGELSPDTDLPLLRDLIFGGTQYLLLFRNTHLSDEKIEQIVDFALAGATFTAPPGHEIVCSQLPTLRM